MWMLVPHRLSGMIDPLLNPQIMLESFKRDQHYASIASGHPIPVLAQSMFIYDRSILLTIELLTYCRRSSNI
jgi:hypothetical protein